MKTEPQKEHEWLQKLVGEWTSESQDPGNPAQKLKGVETVRSLGGLWVVCQGQGEMPGGGTGTMMMTLGYDPKRKRYTGTWVGSMMTHLWVYEGSVDAAGKVLTLETDGPSMTSPDKMTQYRDIIEFRSDAHRTLTGCILGDDGKWQPMVKVDYRRKK